MWRSVVAIFVIGCGRINFDARVDGGGSGPEGDGAIAANIAFVTSTQHVPGAIGGMSGADDICAARAAEAGLPGSYVAWLSTPTVDARTRLGTARGWVRPDGKPVADTVADLATKYVWYPLVVDEHGRQLDVATDQFVVTATTRDGLLSPFTTCGDFTITGADLVECGDARASAGRFTELGSTTSPCRCDAPARLYCFGTSRQVPVVVMPQPGRIAFYALGAATTPGLLAADSHCQMWAASAGLAGSFRALLPTTSAPASARFDLGGPTWVRPDGLPLARTAVDFMDAKLEIPLAILADGTPVGNWATTGAGSGPPSTSAGPTCQDWTVRDSSSVAIGDSSFIGPGFWSSRSSNCMSSFGMYCLQE